MSDVMLHGVLRMPPNLWRDDPIDVAQRHSRYVEASERIEAQDAEIAKLTEREAGLRRDAERYERLKADMNLQFICFHRREADEWDAEIDAAIAKEAGKAPTA